MSVAVLILKAWDESKHSRHPAGKPVGGEFATVNILPAAETSEVDDSTNKDSQVYIKLRETLRNKISRLEKLWGFLSYLRHPVSGMTDERIAQLRDEYTEKKTLLVEQYLDEVFNEDEGNETIAIEMKHHVVTRLSRKKDKDPKGEWYDFANKRIKAWAESSQAGHSLFMQRAAAREFDAPLSEWLKREFIRNYKPSGGMNASERREGHLTFKKERQFLRNMYNKTQESLRNFPDYVTLYRGTSENQEAGGRLAYKHEIAELKSNPLSSWSISPSIALRFGGRVYKMRVHKSRIISTPLTGFGCLSEQEFVVIGVRRDKARRVH